MKISKSMRGFALTVLLMPIAAQASMPKMRDYVESAALNWLTYGLVFCGINAQFHPQEYGNAYSAFTKTLSITTTYTLLGSLIGYLDYRKKMGEFESKQKPKKAQQQATFTTSAFSAAYDSAIGGSEQTIESITEMTKKRKAEEENFSAAYESAIKDSPKVIESIAKETEQRKEQEEQLRTQVHAKRLLDLSKNKI